VTARDERFLAAWDARFGDGCELSPQDIVERWAAIAEDYPGGWVQLAVDLCAGLPNETSEPEFFTPPGGEPLNITPPTLRSVVAELVGGIRSAALSMVEDSGPFSMGAEREYPLPPWATAEPDRCRQALWRSGAGGRVRNEEGSQ
jgi:hypothetical protein